MKIYLNLFSPNCRKVALLSAYLKIDAEFVTLNIPAGDTEKPEYLAMNPNGLAPTLRDGDFVLWESNAILQYLAEKSGNAEVWPKDLRTRSLITQWQLWETNHLGRAIMMLGFENFMKKIIMGESADEATVSEYTGYFRVHAKVLDAHLAKSAFLVGDHPTLADFALAGSMQFVDHSNVPIREFPRVANWFERMRGLEAWKKTEPKLG